MDDTTDSAVAPHGLTTTLRATVTADQIDQLGHMNVSHYASHAQAAGARFLQLLGVDLDGTSLRGEPGVRLVATDPLTAHRAEQLEGAPLAMGSAVVDAGPDEIRVYHELANTELDQLSATFVHRLSMYDVGPWERRPFADEVVATALRHRGRIPDHGHPRTLGVDDAVYELGLDEARARGLAVGEPFTVAADRVDEYGRVPAEAVHSLTYGPRAPSQARPSWADAAADPVTWLWATMESRHRVFRPPRAGDRVQAFSAEVHMTDKVFQRRSWVFDVEDGEMIAATDVVGLAFDPDTRRATTFSPALRAELESRFHPDLR